MDEIYLKKLEEENLKLHEANVKVNEENIRLRRLYTTAVKNCDLSKDDVASIQVLLEDAKEKIGELNKAIIDYSEENEKLKKHVQLYEKLYAKT